MAAAMKRRAAPGDASSSHTEGGKEVLRIVLAALDRCVEELQQPGDAVSLSINWDQIQCVPDAGRLGSILQRHISSLQPVLSQLCMEGEQDPSVTEPAAGSHAEDVTISSQSDNAAATTPVPRKASNTTDPAAVQIQAGKSEIDRRIWAFMERKQGEINENNIREFCNVIDSNQENSCARTDAVFTSFPGFKSHVKVSRVVNAYGPQTRSGGSSSGTQIHPAQRDCGNPGVEERLQNMECHLQLLSGGPVPRDIYQRIKRLEDRILELEGISPEYFQSLDMASKRKKVQPRSRKYTLLELDQKMNALRQSLLQKSEK